MASLPHLSAPLIFLDQKTEEPSDEFPASVQYARFTAGGGSGFFSQLRCLRMEHAASLAHALVSDYTGPQYGFCVWEVFRNQSTCHLAFDVDLKPDFPDGRTIVDLVHGLFEAVFSAYAAVARVNRLPRFDAIVWTATRPGKQSFHVHYYRLRMSFSEQVEMARWVKHYLHTKAGADWAWLDAALDIGPNERGHLRVPLSHKFERDEGLVAGSQLVLLGVYDGMGEKVDERRADRAPWTKWSVRLEGLVAFSLHLLEHKDKVHVQMGSLQASRERKLWRRKRIADEQRLAPRVDSDDEAVEPLSGIDMLDWSPESCLPADFMRRLAKLLSKEEDPYVLSVRWFARRATIVGNCVAYKVLEGSSPSLEYHVLNDALYNQYPKVTVIPPGSDRGRPVSFLRHFLESHQVREHYRSVELVPRGVHLGGVDDATGSGGKLNAWTGWLCDRFDLAKYDNAVSDMAFSDVADDYPLHYVLYYIFWDMCNGSEDHFKAFVWFLAHLVQRPGEKTGRVLVVHGSEGVGKSTFFVDFFLKRVLGMAHTVVLSRSSDITGNFNSLLENRLLCVCEEAMLNDARSADEMKHLITGDYITINKKNQPQRQQRNLLNFVLLSNRTVPMVMGKESRRPIVIRTNDRFANMDPALKHQYHTERTELLAMDKTVEQLAWFLSRLNLDQWDAERTSRLYFSREFDMMRVAALEPGLKLAADCINLETNGGLSPVAVACYPGTANWSPQRLQEPWWSEKVKEFNGASHEMKQTLVSLGCSFEVRDTIAVIVWPKLDDFKDSFQRLVPGLDLLRLNRMAEVVEPPPLDGVGPGTGYFQMFRPLECERVALLAHEQSQASLKQSVATPPITPPRRRSRPPREVDSDSDEEPLRWVTPRSPSPMDVRSDPPSPERPQMVRSLAMVDEELVASLGGRPRPSLEEPVGKQTARWAPDLLF